MDLISEHLAMIKSDIVVDKPVYCSDAGRAVKTEKYRPGRFNIVEGEVATYGEFSEEKALATFLGSNVNEFKKYGASTKVWADVVLFCDKDYSLTIQKHSSSLNDYFV